MWITRRFSSRAAETLSLLFPKGMQTGKYEIWSNCYEAGRSNLTSLRRSRRIKKRMELHLQFSL